MITFTAIGLVTTAALGAAPGQEITGGPSCGLTTWLIVELEPGENIDAVNADYGMTLLASVGSRDLYLTAYPGVATDAEVDELTDDPRVDKAERDDDALAPEAADGDTQPIFFYVPPDAFDGQFAMSLIDLDAAHLVATGADVIVAVIDTGLDTTHELFAGRIAPGGYNFIDNNTDVADVATGLDLDGDGMPDELYGHGTFVAGIIAATAPEASILPIRVLDSEGHSNLFRVVQGIYYAIDHGADVINLSLGAKSHTHILRNAVADAYDAGVIVVAAVGDDDREHPAQVPAGEDTTIAVAATEDNDVKCDFSSYGDHVSLTAPGRDVVSAMPGGEYAEASGTSISTAFVSGAVALLRSADPGLTQADIETLLYGTALDIDGVNPEYAGLLGAGRMDTAAAVIEAAPPPPTPDPNPRNFDAIGTLVRPISEEAADLLGYLGIGAR